MDKDQNDGPSILPLEVREEYDWSSIEGAVSKGDKNEIKQSSSRSRNDGSPKIAYGAK